MGYFAQNFALWPQINFRLPRRVLCILTSWAGSYSGWATKLTSPDRAYRLSLSHTASQPDRQTHEESSRLIAERSNFPPPEWRARRGTQNSTRANLRPTHRVAAATAAADSRQIPAPTSAHKLIIRSRAALISSRKYSPRRGL